MLIFIFLCLIFLLAIGGYYIRALTVSGSVGAFIVGTMVTLGFKGEGLVLLLAFFISSSAWSMLKKKKTRQVTKKGSRRDIVQVFANGGAAALAAVCCFIWPSPLWIGAFICTLAEANADTWASEIGPLGRNAPFHITRFKRVMSGTSGAISGLGTFAALVGSCFIAFLAGFIFRIEMEYAVLFALIGFIGNFIDTFLGATVQVSYQCTVCGEETEKLEHCHKTTEYYKGLSFCSNDSVNFLSTVMAALLGGGVIWIIG
ncbi:DUF92 domain-containing protein [Bacillus taeanensis]|uniref:DUF92 domain-containing protein n=1 Tax=Bacillus taeanensis TaxID=273032 RepID=A0A366XWM4_9BACI|nr:DUF92 domain-containing protein [Bacillus taeanensis]RBW70552.1 DUF92 domain-containing protein [Bacillus taeanensis]